MNVTANAARPQRHLPSDSRSMPPLLLGVIVLFWGLQSGLLPIALIIAIALELSQRVTWRWPLTDREMNRVVDLSSLLILLGTIYFFVDVGASGIFALLTWLPVFLFPLVGAQRYSTAQSIKLSSLFMSLRRAQGSLAAADQRVDLSPALAAICLISAASNPSEHYWMGLLLVSAWGLWWFRPLGHHALVWSAALGLSVVLASGIYTGLQVAKGYADRWLIELLSGWHRPYDPYRRNTAIGELGTLKIDNAERILYRIEVDEQLPTSLLRRGSFDRYAGDTWYARSADFIELEVESDLSTWSIAPEEPRRAAMRIDTYLTKGTGILPLPAEVRELQELKVLLIEYNRLGVVKVQGGPNFVSFVAEIGDGRFMDGDPTERDLSVPAPEQPALRAALARLPLDWTSAADAELAQAMVAHLQGFDYTLVQTLSPGPGQSPLGHFLTHTRAGHCEYFATAAVLMLREAGIPARYVSGFLMDEYDPETERFIIRQRHAHAWAVAWIDGAWQRLDPTPSQWLALEAESDPWWRPLRDAWSHAMYRFSSWRWAQREAQSQSWLLIPLFLLGALLVYRLARKERLADSPGDAEMETAELTGGDSPFFGILAHFQRQGRGPRRDQALGFWLGELPPEQRRELEPMLNLHRRYRFDPRGLTPDEAQALSRQARNWLARQRRR